MKFLFISEGGNSLDIAFRVTQEGNEAAMWIQEKGCKEVGDGFISKIDSWERHVGWADIIVVDDVFEKGGFGAIADNLRKSGHNVFGGSQFGEKIENDRAYGMQIAEQAGLLVPPHYTFKNFTEAEKFIRKNPSKYVVKPNGQMDRNFCYVGKDPSGEDMLNYFHGFDKKGGKITKVEFTLQQVIDGVEVGCSSYFSNGHFMENVNYNFEHKKLLSGNLGGNTGETGTILFNRPAEDGNDKNIFKQTLNKMEPFLRKAGYRGWIDTNCIANEKGVWFLEFTSRWGYPQALILKETMLNDWSEDIYSVATGTMKKWDVSYDFSAGIVVYSEGFPYSCAYEKLGKDREITGINGHTLEHIHLGEVKREKENIITTGETGWSLIATGKGKTAKEASKAAEAFANKVDFVNKGYRNDIGMSSDRDYSKLISLGVL